MKIALSFDVEPDLHTNDYKGITLGIRRILSLLDKHNIKATFFTTCDCIEKDSTIFKSLLKEGHEIALHGYRHVRFDELSLKEKEEQFRKASACFKKHLRISPAGFRAPQHSIDQETLSLLEKNKFKYDSSQTPLNLLQLLFFPKKHKLNLINFFTTPKKHRIGRITEIPTTSLLLPFVSIIFRALPKSFIKIYLFFLRLFYREAVFYAHSWDFIDVHKSRLARKYPKEKLINNFKFFLESSKKNQFCRIIDFLN